MDVLVVLAAMELVGVTMVGMLLGNLVDETTVGMTTALLAVLFKKKGMNNVYVETLTSATFYVL